MTTSEPTTGEMIAIMRGEYDTQKSMPRITLRMLVDRLESQEREIAELKAEAIVNALENAERIANLTARADQAERERDAAKSYMKRFGCLTCIGQGTLAMNDPCGSCRDKSKWEMRGLPQDGEGK